MKLCVHRPAGGEVSTLPSTPAAERAVSRQLAPKRGETLWWGPCCHACAATRLPRAKKRRGGYPNSVSCYPRFRDRIERKSRNPAPLFDPAFTRAFTRERDFLNLWKMGDGESEILVSRKETCLSNHCGVPRMMLLRKI